MSIASASTLRTLPWDWHPGTVPPNVVLDESAYLETTYSFWLYRSELQEGVQIGRGTTVYLGSMFDVGRRGRVVIGDFVLVNGAWFICDAAIEVGDHALISWNVVFMDSYRAPLDPSARRSFLKERSSGKRESAETPRPIRIGRNVWIGFDCCILPGVTIGEGAIVGARSVVASDVPPYTVVAGNPARVIRQIENDEVRPTS
jgi:acetyltransferase-like isoleucine patch superfamily enzyme